MYWYLWRGVNSHALPFHVAASRSSSHSGQRLGSAVGVRNIKYARCGPALRVPVSVFWKEPRTSHTIGATFRVRLSFSPNILVHLQMSLRSVLPITARGICADSERLAQIAVIAGRNGFRRVVAAVHAAAARRYSHCCMWAACYRMSKTMAADFVAVVSRVTLILRRRADFVIHEQLRFPWSAPVALTCRLREIRPHRAVVVVSRAAQGFYPSLIRL